jgi:hypothetical protein
MKKATTDARNCNSFRYKKLVFSCLLFFCIAVKGLHAQNIYFQFSNSSFSQYLLSDIRKITFTVSDMNLNMADGSLVSLPLNKISNFNYKGFTGNTGITSLTKGSNISVYPNPSKGTLTINYNAPASGNVSIDFLSTNGTILNTIARQSKARENTFSLIAKDFAGQDLPQGMYLCRIRNSEKSSVVKIIISK